MHVFAKVFLIVLIIKNIKAELKFCDNENVQCNVKDIKFSDNETADLISLFKLIIERFNAFSQKYENKINTIREDIGYIKNTLQHGNRTNSAIQTTNTRKNETKTEAPPSLYDNLWAIIQRRQDGSTDFNRNWYHYKQGFGNPFREFFIGLDKIHYLTNSARHELLIRLEDFKGSIKYALYDEFLVGNETEKYKLKKLGIYSGNAGDYLRNHEGMYFSTKNVDNDGSVNLHCAKVYRGGWWYNNCMTSNLNGPFRTRYVVSNVNMTWGYKNDTQHKIVQMMLRLKP